MLSIIDAKKAKEITKENISDSYLSLETDLLKELGAAMDQGLFTFECKSKYKDVIPHNHDHLVNLGYKIIILSPSNECNIGVKDPIYYVISWE